LVESRRAHPLLFGPLGTLMQRHGGMGGKVKSTKHFRYHRKTLRMNMWGIVCGPLQIFDVTKCCKTYFWSCFVSVECYVTPAKLPTVMVVIVLPITYYRVARRIVRMLLVSKKGCADCKSTVKRRRV
jgi:hypothetical protein